MLHSLLVGFLRGPGIYCLSCILFNNILWRTFKTISVTKINLFRNSLCPFLVIRENKLLQNLRRVVAKMEKTKLFMMCMFYINMILWCAKNLSSAKAVSSSKKKNLSPSSVAGSGLQCHLVVCNGMSRFVMACKVSLGNESLNHCISVN